MSNQQVKDAVNRATEIAKVHDGDIERGIKQATAGQPRSFILDVRAELCRRGFDSIGVYEMNPKGTVKIIETLNLKSGLVKFEATWPSGKTFTKYVDHGDDVNERARQERFAEERGYEVEWDEEGIVHGE